MMKKNVGNEIGEETAETLREEIFFNSFHH